MVIFAGLALLACGLPGLALEAPPRIHRIAIEGNTRTRSEIIRRELLFAQGEPLDTTRLAETERNLRRLLFLGQVTLQVQEQGDSAQVQVQVQDLYSRALSPLLSGQLDELSYGLVGLDYNFLGRGQSLRLAVEHRAISGNQAELSYQEPRLLGSRHALGLAVGLGEEGHDLGFSLSRPFAALADQRAYGLSLFSRESVQRLYAGGRLAHRYEDRLNGARAWFALSRGDRLKVRPSFQISLSERTFAPSPGYEYAPRDRRRLVPSLGLTLWRPRYEKARFIHLLGPVEDLQTGSWVFLGAGLSSRSLGSDRDFALYQIQLSPRLKPSGRGYLFATFFSSIRQDAKRFYELFSLAELEAYFRWGQAHSMALRLHLDALHRPEDAAQLLLGLDQGLRGYAPRRFDGTRRLLFNLEGRPTLYRHSWYALAGAVFLDGGTAWTPGRTSPDVRLAPGLGVRVGLPRVYNTPVLRADLAWAAEDGAWQFSVGLGQYF